MTGVFPWPLETVSQDIEGAFRVSEKTAGGKRLSDGELRSVLVLLCCRNLAIHSMQNKLWGVDKGRSREAS